MKIGSTVKADAGYKIDFSRIDNPVEAVLIPPLDFVALSSGKDADAIKGTVKAGGDQFQITASTAKGYAYTYKGKTNQCTIENTALGANTLTGRIGESEIKLNVETGLVGIGISGKTGDVEVDETVTMNPGAIMFGGALVTQEGTVGGLEYQEEFFIAEDENGKQAILSKGHLGEMEIQRVITEDEKGNKKIQGHIGDTEVDEYFIYNPSDNQVDQAKIREMMKNGWVANNFPPHN